MRRELFAGLVSLLFGGLRLPLFGEEEGCLFVCFCSFGVFCFVLFEARFAGIGNNFTQDRLL